jgi:hypothetical protein
VLARFGGDRFYLWHPQPPEEPGWTSLLPALKV